MEIFKDFFACKIVLAAKHQYLGNIQRLFRLQNCLSRKTSISWKYSKTFSLAKLSQPPNIIILEIFKDFSAGKIVLTAKHQNPGNVQRLFRLQNCLSRKTSLSLKYSKVFSPTSSIPAATSNHPATSSNHQQTAVINNSQHQHDQCQIQT